MTGMDRSPAQYCPYCGETNLWPHEQGHGSWECRDCGRVFTVKFNGLSSRVLSGSQRGGDPDSSEVGEAR